MYDDTSADQDTPSAGRPDPGGHTSPPEPPSEAPPLATPPVPPQASSRPIHEPEQPDRKGISAGAVVAIALAVSLFAGAFAGGFGGFAGAWVALRGTTVGEPGTVRVVPAETDEPVVAAAAAAVPSVVTVEVRGATHPATEDPLPEGHPGVPRQVSGSGVAFMAAPEGGTYIITNAHVVATAEAVIVRGADRERHEATVVGADAETDIAVVRVDVDFPAISIGDSDMLEVGQLVTAIGSPFGLQHTVTSGVVSAIGRAVTTGTGQRGVYPLVDVIQTDAAINPGNSGGALVDREGRLVGINTAIVSETGVSGGIGFAVPVNTAVRIAEALIETGVAEHPFLGIVGQTVTPGFAEAEGLPVEEGAYVVDLVEGGKAAEAGLVPGDVIVALDGVPIFTMDDLILEVRRHEIGDVVTLEVWRDGERMELEMEVGVKPDDLEIPQPEMPPVPEMPPEMPDIPDSPGMD